MRSYLFSFILPESMTYTTSSMVTEVSAMFVEMMIFVTPSWGRLKTACCSSLDKVEWSGYTAHLTRGKNSHISQQVTMAIRQKLELHLQNAHTTLITDLVAPLLLNILLDMSCS